MRTIAKRKPRYGDVIGVDRGLYQHYGVYISPESVIEYGSASGDFGGEIRVQEVSLKKFLGDDSEFFICVFPDIEQSDPDASPHDWVDLLRLIRRTFKGERYHLYTPEETVQRARSKLGETQYNLLLRNCEHFAIWCKTGVSESSQVNRILHMLEDKIKLRFSDEAALSNKSADGS